MVARYALLSHAKNHRGRRHDEPNSSDSIRRAPTAPSIASIFCSVLDSPHVNRGRFRLSLHHAVYLHLNVHLVVDVVFEKVKNQLPTTRGTREGQEMITSTSTHNNNNKKRENNKDRSFSIHETVRGKASLLHARDNDRKKMKPTQTSLGIV